MADLSKTVQIVFGATNQASPVINDIDTSLKGIGDEAADSSLKIDDLAESYGELGGKRQALDDLALAMKALAAAVVVKEFIEANVAYEQFIKTMTIATGSQEAAAQEFEYIKDVANRFGTELLSTADAYAKFASAAKGTAIEGEDARRIFEAFAGTMASTGASAADVSGAMTQLAQGVSKGKFELDDLKSIAERIPGFFQQFAESLGVTTEDLYDMISAGQIGAVELQRFAEDANKALLSVDFDGFVAAQNRMTTAISDAYIRIGDAGAFDLLATGVNAATAVVVTATSALTVLGGVIEAMFLAIWKGEYDQVGERIAAAFVKAEDQIEKLRNKYKESAVEAENSGNAGAQAGDKIAAGMEKAKLSSEELAKRSKEVDSALKELGIDPKQFEEPVERITQAFIKLASNPAASGDQILAGFLVTLDKIKSGPDGLKDIEQAVVGLAAAQASGSLSTEQYTAALQALEVKNGGLWDGMIRTTDATNKQADSLKAQAKAADDAAYKLAQLQVQMEKIASEERTKTFEAQIKLDIAKVEADAQIVSKQLDNLFNMYQADLELVTQITGQIGDGYSAGDRFRMKLADEYTERSGELHKAQLKIIDAQVEYMQAKTAALSAGNPIMTIQADGLEPHLRGLMWEIFREIQIKMAQDGGDLIVGGLI